MSENIAKSKVVWLEYDDGEGNPYYYNPETEECLWEKPKELEEKKPDWGAYLNRYPDLKAAFGNDHTMAENHWNTHGKKEGRDCSPEH